MGDFNIDILKYTTDTSTAHFLDQMYSSSLIPQITSPIRIRTKWKTLIDNIISIDNPEEPISIITSISDRLAQFQLSPIEKNEGNKKKQIHKNEFQKTCRKRINREP